MILPEDCVDLVLNVLVTELVELLHNIIAELIIHHSYYIFITKFFKYLFFEVLGTIHYSLFSHIRSILISCKFQKVRQQYLIQDNIGRLSVCCLQYMLYNVIAILFERQSVAIVQNPRDYYIQVLLLMRLLMAKYINQLLDHKTTILIQTQFNDLVLQLVNQYTQVIIYQHFHHLLYNEVTIFMHHYFFQFFK